MFTDLTVLMVVNFRLQVVYEGHGHSHENPNKKTQSLPGASDLFSDLTSFTIKPEDPLPNFEDFDESIELTETMIEEFQKTIKLIQAKKYTEAGV